MYYTPKAGLGNASSYIVSGIPSITSITVPHSGASVYTASFEFVPRRITVKNTLAASATNVPLIFGFYNDCFDKTEYILLNNQESFTDFLRPKTIYLSSNTSLSGLTASIIVELTGIQFNSDFQWHTGSTGNVNMNYPKVGINNVSSYQVSGIPQVYGPRPISTKTEYTFRRITRQVTIKNEMDPTAVSAPLRVGFSSLGIDGDNYFTLQNGESYTGEWKVGSIWLKADSTDTSGSIIAGLTGIIYNNDFTNWSGSIGVG